MMAATKLDRVIEQTGKPRIVGWTDGYPSVFVPGYSKQFVTVRRLLSDGDGNTKTRKNVGYVSCGLSLSHASSAGIGNVCGNESPGCENTCLDDQGRAAIWETIRAARTAKTALWYLAREWFLETLRADLERFTRKAIRASMPLCCRPNMFSDIRWERTGLIDSFPEIEWYDYTKHPQRVGQVRPNYWTTFSRSETNEAEALQLLSSGCNVAVCFHTVGHFVGNRAHLQRLPKSWRGFPVVDGDVTDLRFDDPRGRVRGRVIGLRLKAHSNAERAKAIASGFSVEVKR